MPRTFTGNHINAGLNYIEPAPFHQPFQLGFTLRVSDETRTIDSEGFEQVTFDGRYPIGRVAYRDDDCPVQVSLEAWAEATSATTMRHVSVLRWTSPAI